MMAADVSFRSSTGESSEGYGESAQKSKQKQENARFVGGVSVVPNERPIVFVSRQHMSMGPVQLITKALSTDLEDFPKFLAQDHYLHFVVSDGSGDPNVAKDVLEDSFIFVGRKSTCRDVRDILTYLVHLYIGILFSDLCLMRYS
ncbi:hypothetical protein CEXT_582241 [Caerostris extrusa]|uniref:Uncharacterized protein n=1 Tax=Caerostris extrusa TaxID=172846 RepID=A0AAV4MBY6_CAEEX|nr:hypothetical protein CEXT_582241 [Caerostris extrusa]